MTTQEAIEHAKSIKAYLTAGNPMWDIEMVETTMDMAISALEAQRWISCEKQFPKYEEEVLVYCESDYMDIAYLDDDWGQDVWRNGYTDYSLSSVIAWMPLPEPYKEGGTE